MKTQLAPIKRFSVLRGTVGLALATLLFFCWGCSSVEQKESTTVGTVTLEISFADESQSAKEMEVACSTNSTVFSIMKAAKAEGKLRFEHRQNLIGEPESIFIESIEGVENGEQKYWTYQVNDELAKQGCGTMLISKDDHVRWVHGQPNAELLTD